MQVYCADCQSELKIIEQTDVKIVVEPCAQCLTEEYDQGRDDGINECE